MSYFDWFRSSLSLSYYSVLFCIRNLLLHGYFAQLACIHSHIADRHRWKYWEQMLAIQANAEYLFHYVERVFLDHCRGHVWWREKCDSEPSFSEAALLFWKSSCWGLSELLDSSLLNTQSLPYVSKPCDCPPHAWTRELKIIT